MVVLDSTDEIYHLQELKQSAMVASAEQEGSKVRIAEMQQFTVEQTETITEYDGRIIRHPVERVTVYDGRFEIRFKSGASVEIRKQDFRQDSTPLRRDVIFVRLFFL